MKKKLLIVLALLVAVPALLLFASCGKQTVKADIGEAADTLSDKGASASDSDSSDSSGSDVTSESLTDAQSLQKSAGPTAQERMAMEKAEAMQALVNEDVRFDFDSAALNERAQEILKKKATYLEKYSAAYVTVTIEGHCDDRGTNEYNLALGEKRAQSAKNFLVNLGIASSRLKTISYGEEKPVDPGQNEGAWVKNRRAHFIIQ
ncbi:MAG: peptidoglycan-associated lipoprotein Pal [Proteobacteria bacterium]|nr:peptidoglycan-associated lipoprotein Pal [Pseudomonadota bacterium]